MKSEVAGMDVPDSAVARMSGLSKEDQAKAGMDLCCEIAQQVMAIEGVRGLHIMAVNWADAVPQVVKTLNLYPRPVIEATGAATKATPIPA
jgi:methylenetetrahydrofolate reductase (NADPH)